MFKQISLLVASALLLPVLAACGAPASSPPAAESTAAPAASTDSSPAAQPAAGTDSVDRSQLASELYFYNWTDYIDPTILEDFEKEYGVKVILETYDANEDMLAKIRAGNSGYDIVVPSDYAVDIMIKEGLAQALDRSMLTNFSSLKPEYTDTYFDPGNMYSLPYFVGVTGIAYNQKFFPTPPSSWADILDPAKIEPFKGKVSMLDDERESIGAALVYMGKSINDTEAASMSKAEEMLLAQKPFLASYNSSDFNRKLASEEVVLAHAWNGGTAQAYAGLGEDLPGNPDIRFIVPKEGGTLWMDNMVMVKDSPNHYTAHVFMNFMLRPEIAARNSNYVYYLTPNQAAEALLSDALKDIYAKGFAPTSEEIKRLQWIKRSDANNTVFSDVWTKIKSS